MTATAGIGSTLRTVLIVASLLAGGLAALATAVAFIGSAWWGFDLMANFRWQLAWISLVCAVIYALSSKGIASVIFLAAAIINALVIAPAWTGSQPAGTGEDGVEVVSLDLSETQEREDALRWVFSTDADVIIMAGVTADAVAPLLVEGSPYVGLVVPGNQRADIAIIAQQAYAVERLETEGFAEPVYVVSVDSGDKVISIATAHGAMATGSIEADQLAARLDTIRGVVDGRTGPVMVIGNLGATVHTAGMRSLIGDTALRDATAGYGYRATTPVSGGPIIGGWIGIPLDVVLMTQDITPFEFDTGPDVGATHLPVTVTVGAALGF